MPKPTTNRIEAGLIDGTLQITRLGIVFDCIFDATDVDIVRQYSWRLTKNKYVIGQGPRPDRTPVLLHRLLTGAPPQKEVDHINHDPLDNRRSNMRIVSHMDNLWNRKGATSLSSTGIRGVHKYRGKYRVRYIRNGVGTTVGYYKNKTTAAQKAKETYEAIT
jgi:hypothetical protein